MVFPLKFYHFVMFCVFIILKYYIRVIRVKNFIKVTFVFNNELIFLSELIHFHNVYIQQHVCEIYMKHSITTFI